VADRLVIFDCDGVLVDSEPISCRVTAEALNKAGVEIDAETVLGRFLGTSTASMLEILEAETGRALPAGFLDDLRLRVLGAFDRELKPVNGVAAAVAALDGPCCVVSSSTPPRIRRSLELTGLYDLFAPHLFSSTMVANGKPAPDLFFLAAERMGFAPADCTVIEDSPAGVQAGRAAGMTVLGFTGGGHARGDHARRLIDAGADTVFAEMADLPALLGVAGAAADQRGRA